MTNQNPAGLDQFQSLEGHEAFDQLALALNRAREEGVLAALPESKAEAGSESLELGKTRVGAIRTRLYLLGYLEEDNGSTANDQTLMLAIGQFQVEAGLESDNWVGLQTWTALAQLVGFEEDTHLDHWLQPQFETVFKRALKSRLKALGMLIPNDEDRLDLAVKRFAAQYNAWLDGNLQYELSPQTFQALFDQEGLLKRIAASSDEDLAQHMIQPLLMAVAKIELWLLGYAVVPDGTMEQINPKSSKNQGPLARAMREFLKQVDGKAPRGPLALDSNFFGKLDLADEDAEDPYQLIYDKVNQEPTVASKLWKSFSHLGNRLWDGLKRAARWAARLLKRAWDKVKGSLEWLKTAARALYQPALKAFEQVKLFANGFGLSLKKLTKKTLPGDHPPLIYSRKSGDFDLTLFIDRSASPQDIQNSTRKFTLTARLFDATLSTLYSLLRLIRKIPGHILSGAGWLGLILALVKLWREIRNMASEFRETVAIFKELKQLEA